MASLPRLLLALLLLLVAAGSLLLALSLGSMPLSLHEVWAGIMGDASLAGEVVRNLRLPRVLGTFACGGLLALAGALMQILLRNPLGDPYVLGISGGASIGALSALLLGTGVFWVSASAFAGAFAVLLLVFGLAHGSGAWVQSRLLLTGVVVASGCGAIVSLILTIAPQQSLPGMLFWLMGDTAQISDARPACGLLGFGLLCALPFARDLNVLSRGDMQAAALGVNVRQLRWITYFLAALLTAGAVATVGSIGFVGLIVPHLVRLLIGNDQRLLLPAAALAGGSLLTLADTCARILVAPQQLPVGVLTALLGVPLFLFLLSRQSRGA